MYSMQSVSCWLCCYNNNIDKSLSIVTQMKRTLNKMKDFSKHEH